MGREALRVGWRARGKEGGSLGILDWRGYLKPITGHSKPYPYLLRDSHYMFGHS